MVPPPQNPYVPIIHWYLQCFSLILHIKKVPFFWIVAIIKHWFNILKNTNKETNIQKLFGEGPLEKIQQIFKKKTIVLRKK